VALNMPQPQGVDLNNVKITSRSFLSIESGGAAQVAPLSSMGAAFSLENSH
jgi:hypothetical protein